MNTTIPKNVEVIAFCTELEGNIKSESKSTLQKLGQHLEKAHVMRTSLSFTTFYVHWEDVLLFRIHIKEL